MGRADNGSGTAAGIAGAVLLFILNVCYIFVSLGLLAFGVIMLPAVLLGRTGMLVMMTDLAQLPLLLISGGVLLLGLGMCFCILPICNASYGVLKGILKAAEVRGKLAREEQAETEDDGEAPDDDNESGDAQ